MRLRESGIPDTARGGVRFPGVSCLRWRVPDAARGGVPPLQRLGALRGRSPRFACPVRPLGRLSLGGVDIDAWYGVRVFGQLAKIWIE